MTIKHNFEIDDLVEMSIKECLYGNPPLRYGTQGYVFAIGLDYISVEMDGGGKRNFHPKDLQRIDSVIMQQEIL